LWESARFNLPRPKTLIVNFPSNPTTECVDLPFLARLVELAKG
jgi:alanine-synthesizing transaminase